ncbi:hypothetical protein [Sphingopyxis terrae]|uniref:hypothetical protein n=1 Tax=Sphingopyxis terrae TaxID=33052 RepID=UPI003F805FD9
MTTRPSLRSFTQYGVSAFILGIALDVTAAAAPGDGGQLQAFGDDPNWTVVVDRNGMSLSIEEDGDPVFRELPAPTASQSGKEQIFRTKTASGVPVELRVSETSCATASEQLAMRATLMVGTARREGCARSLEDTEALTPRPLLGDLAMDSRIVSKGGPPGYELDIQESGTRIVVGDRELQLGKPIAVQIGGTMWPIIAGGAATYALANDDETVTARAIVEAADCKTRDKIYPMTLTLVLDGKTYESCAAQAYRTLNMPTFIPPMLATPER